MRLGRRNLTAERARRRMTPTWLARALLISASVCMLTLGCGDDSTGTGDSADGAVSADAGATPSTDAAFLDMDATHASDGGGASDAASAQDGASLDAAVADGALADAAAADAASDAAVLTLVSIAISPPSPTIAVGTSLALEATGLFSDNSTRDVTGEVQWTSSDPSRASLGGTHGAVASALAAGQVTISATLGSVVGAISFTVSSATLTSLAVTPSSSMLAAGTKLQFTATGTFSDATTQDLTASATWSSSMQSAATVDAAGLATGLALGDTTISASFAGQSGVTPLHVTSATLTAVTISPALPSIAKGTRQQFVATGSYSDGTTQDLSAQVSWTSATPAVASISSVSGSQGLATGLSAGSTMIGASVGALSASTTLTVTGSTLTSISVTPANPSIAKGTSQAFVATGLYSDNSTQDISAAVTWASSAPTIASIGNAAGSAGVALGVAAGHVTISATLSAISGSTGLTVTPATLVSIALSPSTPTVAKNSAQQFAATGTYSDSSTQDITALVVWASSDTAVATIGNGRVSRGFATTLAAGQTTISATRAGVMGSTVLTVSNATVSSIAVTPSASTAATGTTLQFRAVATYSDATTQDVTTTATWSSSSTNIALVSNTAGSKGLATAVGGGSTNVRASVNGTNGTTGLTVTAAMLVSITVTPDNQRFALGHTQQYTARGTYADSSTQDLTTQVTWSSSNQTVAVVSNTPGSRGLASAVTAGSTTIRALGPRGVMGTTMATVVP